MFPLLADNSMAEIKLGIPSILYFFGVLNAVEFITYIMTQLYNI